MIDDRTIIQATEKHRGNLDEAAKALVGAANRGGGEDNITVVFFEVTDDAPDDTAITQQAPVVEASTSEDEDTLSGLEGVPPVDTMVVAPEDAAAFSERPKRRGRAMPLLAAVAILLIIAAAVLWLLEHA
jgi:hypothetical protein